MGELRSVDSGRNLDNPVVYVIVDHDGAVVNVYADYVDAIAWAAKDVSSDPMYTHIENYEYTIYVTGDRGYVCILVEELQ